MFISSATAIYCFGKKHFKHNDGSINIYVCCCCFSNGKPGETAVVDEFRIDWGTYMSSHNDVIYIRLDVRGARGQGKKKLYRHLGGVEVADQIAVLEWVNYTSSQHPHDIVMMMMMFYANVRPHSFHMPTKYANRSTVDTWWWNFVHLNKLSCR